MAAKPPRWSGEAEDNPLRLSGDRSAPTGPCARGAGSDPLADRGSEAGASERASLPKGRARFEKASLGEFERLVVETAQRLLAGEHANTATLRPSQVAKLLGLKDAALYSAVADILKHHPELDGWRLARVERRNSLVYLRYERTVLRCPRARDVSLPSAFPNSHRDRAGEVIPETGWAP